MINESKHENEDIRAFLSLAEAIDISQKSKKMSWWSQARDSAYE
jgi:hypothetical protein